MNALSTLGIILVLVGILLNILVILIFLRAMMNEQKYHNRELMKILKEIRDHLASK